MLVPRKRGNENLQPFADGLNDLAVKREGLLIVHYVLPSSRQIGVTSGQKRSSLMGLIRRGRAKGSSTRGLITESCIGRESNPGLAESSKDDILEWQRPILPLNHQCSMKVAT